MGVALLADTADVITSVAGIGALGGEYSLLQTDKTLYKLEC